MSAELWEGDDESRTRYLRYRAWPDLGKFYSDMCTNCRRYSDEDLAGGTLAELMAQEFGYVQGFARGPVGSVKAGSVRLQYQCPRCSHVWTCNFSEDSPLWNGADPSILSWLLSLFPRGSAWDKNEVWVLV